MNKHTESNNFFFFFENEYVRLKIFVNILNNSIQIEKNRELYIKVISFISIIYEPIIHIIFKINFEKTWCKYER